MEGKGHFARNKKFKVNKGSGMSRSGLSLWHLILVAVIVVFIAVIAAFSSSSSAHSTLSNFVVTSNPATFKLGGVDYMAYIGSSGAGFAQLYIERSPIPLNPLFRLTLSVGNNTAVNTEGNSNYANLEVRPVSISNTSVTLDMEAINASLGVPVSSIDVSVVTQAQLGSSSKNNTTTTVGTTTTSTSTLTTSVSTTSVSAAQSTQAEVIAILEHNSTYALIANYTALYANTKNCTSNEYNTTYTRATASFPSGPTTYANASKLTPYKMALNITSNGGAQYTATFSTVAASSLVSGAAAQFVVNTNTDTILSGGLKGFFSSEGYSGLERTYESSAAYGACGVIALTG